MNTTRSRWAAIGAAVAVTLGAGGIGIANATTDSSEGPVAAFFPIEPCRLVENAAITEDSSIMLNGWGMSGDCDLPDDITGLAANVTAVNATAQTNLRFYAEGGDVPETANLNPTPGAPPTPNAVNITLNDTNGQFQVYNRFGTVNVFIDVMGYYDNHTHDDRYYTKSEIDARPLAFGGSFLGIEVDGGANRFNEVVTLPDTGTPSFTISFGLPAGRDASRPIIVQFPVSAPPNCTVKIGGVGVAGPFDDSTRFLNAGWSVVDSPDGLIEFGPNPSGSASATTIVRIESTSSSPLSSGASLELELTRLADDADDTCAGNLVARGGYGVEY